MLELGREVGLSLQYSRPFVSLRELLQLEEYFRISLGNAQMCTLQQGHTSPFWLQSCESGI